MGRAAGAAASGFALAPTGKVCSNMFLQYCTIQEYMYGMLCTVANTVYD